MEKLNLPFKNNQEVTQGCFLLSDPFQQDPHFERSVVFICEHNENGTFGFVLNNYIDLNLDAVLDNPLLLNHKLSIGGPVSNEHLYFLHGFGNLISDSLECKKGVSFSGNYNALVEYGSKIKETFDNKIRFFIGYSGWDPGQLQQEMSDHSWIAVDNIPSTYIFEFPNERLWEKCMELQGPKFSMISKFPKNPQEN